MTRLASRFGAANLIRRDRPLTREELFRVTLIAEGQRCERLAPCRLLIHQQAWYLVAEHDGHIAVFTLNEIHLVQPLQESFRRNDSLCSLVKDPVFIQALPHFRFIQQSLLAFVPADSPPE